MGRNLQEAVHGRQARAVGPAWVGQIVAVEVTDERDNQSYRVQWLPDRNNDELRKAGRPMHFYYLPDRPRVTRDEDDHYIFHVQKFSGVMDPARNIGEDGYAEIAGGLLNFTATLGLPANVLDRAFEALKEQLPNEESRPWYHWGSEREDREAPPVLAGPVALRENQTVLHSVRPDNATEEGSGEGPEAWAYEIQGAGDGALNVQASNAFTVMLGSRPVQMLQASAESGTSQITLENHIAYEVWSLVTEIRITGEWETAFEHFSTHLSGSPSWMSNLDVKYAMDKMVQDGALSVEVSFGAGMVDAKQQERYEDAADDIAQTFMEMIEQRLSNAEEFIQDLQNEDAKAEPGTETISFLGRSFSVTRPGFTAALNRRKVDFKGSLNYHKKINKQTLRNEVVSSNLSGVFDKLRQDDSAWDRYFSEVFLEEGFRKIHVIARANANWGSDDNPGDPIDTLNLQVGYSDSEGNLNWKSTARYKENDASPSFAEAMEIATWTRDTKDRIYAFDFTRHETDERPSEQIDLKKIIRFREHPNVAVREVTETEQTDVHIVEIRADSSGHLNVSPISIDMPINEDDEQIEVLVHVRTATFPEKVFTFDASTMDDSQAFSVWYASADDIEPYEYKVEVIIQGRRFGQSSLRWENEWTTRSGSGPLTAEVPPIPDELEETVNEYLGFD